MPLPLVLHIPRLNIFDRLVVFCLFARVEARVGHILERVAERLGGSKVLRIDEERGGTRSDRLGGLSEGQDPGVAQQEVEQREAGEEDAVQVGEGEGIGEGIVLVESTEDLPIISKDRIKVSD